jgi:anti-sigma B factor antagonist
LLTSTEPPRAFAGATFHCPVHPNREAAVVAPVGELDLATAPILEAQLEQLLEAGFRQLVVDLRGLSFLDSTGVQLLLRWDAGARQDGHTFSLIAGPERIQKVLTVTGVVDHLSFTHP